MPGAIVARLVAGYLWLPAVPAGPSRAGFLLMLHEQGRSLGHAFNRSPETNALPPEVRPARRNDRKGGSRWDAAFGYLAIRCPVSSSSSPGAKENRFVFSSHRRLCTCANM